MDHIAWVFGCLSMGRTETPERIRSTQCDLDAPEYLRLSVFQQLVACEPIVRYIPFIAHQTPLTHRCDVRRRST
jgi:hypothetical protein